ncbi:MAG: glycosyltransferase family 2 protein [Candidatus Omnitrophota bacterium]
MPDVYIIILNWNGWTDTIPCLDSVFQSRLKSATYRVIVCDNQSTDDSIARIQTWAEGKGMAYLEYDRTQAENGGRSENEDPTPLVLIHNGSNRGFSAGNNVGIRYALNQHADYIWLLNNDTQITPDTLNELIDAASDPFVGIVGALIYDTQEPPKVQAFGGGRVHPITGAERVALNADEAKRITYICGASLFIKAEVVRHVGLLDESFFFYWEDVDFSRRVKGNGWRLSVAENAVVYHRCSASVGKQSLASDRLKVRAFVRYHRKYYTLRWIVPVALHVSAMILNRLARGQLERILPIIAELLKSITGKNPDGDR